jgi:hypothetical protein
MSKRTKKEATDADNGSARPLSRLYRVTVRPMPVARRILEVVANDPMGPHVSEREIAAFVYELSAEMERRSQDRKARWVVAPDPSNSQIVLELGSDDKDEAVGADEFLTQLLADHDLA